MRSCSLSPWVTDVAQKMVPEVSLVFKAHKWRVLFIEHFLCAG